jgi:RNA ligase (TIGR02306 family)
VSDFSVRVVRIAEPVVDHPNADRLSLIKIGGYTCISAKLEDGSHRYKQGDYVVYVPEGAVVPEYLLKPGFWSEEKGKGILAGSNGDRVKALKLRGIFSQGILFPVDKPDYFEHDCLLTNGEGETRMFHPDDDVAEFLAITKYEPPIPIGMAGEVTFVPSGPVKFDFESIQRVTDLFDPGEMISVTEKLHGTCFQVGFVPDLAHPDCFLDGNIYVNSKGLGAQGLCFKNNEANANNLYVRVLRSLLADEFGDRIAAISILYGDKPVRIFGEIIGQGVQDLGYGLKTPEVRVFDIRVGASFLTPRAMREAASALGLQTVPVLYEGPFDLPALETFRDGKDTLSGSHVREGIVIRSQTGEYHPVHGRKIGKYVSPDYLLRKNGTEYN